MHSGPVLHPLAWDSGAFGFPVARIEGVSIPSAQLNGVQVLLARSGTRLAYWEWPSADPAVRAAARLAGGDFVNTRVELSISSHAGLISAPAAIVTSATPADREVLDELALASGWSSRFKLDPRFPDYLFRQLYRSWMAKSLSGELADAVLVARSGSTVRGMITVSARNGHGRIGLFGVSEQARGRGVGKTLLCNALAWFAEQGCIVAGVATQGENEAALAVYRAAGFSIDTRSDVFHFWSEGT